MALSSSVLDIGGVMLILFIIVNICTFEFTFSAEEHGSMDRSVTNNNQDITSNVDDSKSFGKPQIDNIDPPAGHLKPLGAHRPPEKNGIDVLDVVPSPLHFFDNYVKDGKPVLFRGAAKNMLAYQLWSDEFLRNTYGDVEVEVEEGKKENRSQGVWNMRLADYVDQYEKKDMYMVHTVPPEMANDVGLVRCLQCDSFTKYLQDAIIWYSSGGTKSVLHFDSVDNINCIIDGEKELFMVDKREKEFIDIDNPGGAFSHVDVDRVDMNKYPGLGKVPWYNVTMHPGDCLFIPFKWFHHVHSQGRNLAVNIWFVHIMLFDRTSCGQKIEDLPEFVPLSQYEIDSSNEQMRAEIVYVLDELGADVLKESNMDFISSRMGVSMKTAKAMFAILDIDHNKEVSLEEVFNGDMSVINKLESKDEESKRDEL